MTVNYTIWEGKWLCDDCMQRGCYNNTDHGSNPIHQPPQRTILFHLYCSQNEASQWFILGKQCQLIFQSTSKRSHWSIYYLANQMLNPILMSRNVNEILLFEMDIPAPLAVPHELILDTLQRPPAMMVYEYWMILKVNTIGILLTKIV